MTLPAIGSSRVAMDSRTIFYLFGLLLLGVMIYVLWSGVGRKRPALGRGFAVLLLGVAVYVGWLLLRHWG